VRNSPIDPAKAKRGTPCPSALPADKGLWNHPTIINNVETLATVARSSCGGEWLAAIGTENPRTKVFAITGKVKKSGLKSPWA
jgi:NADH:ubiquinone oxidoreductase subunit F (NADH-binding)